VALRGLPLRAVLPYVELPMPVELRSGILGARGTLTLPAGKPAALRFAGEASLDNFTAYEKGVEAPLAGWKGLALSGLRYAPAGWRLRARICWRPSGGWRCWRSHAEFHGAQQSGARGQSGACGQSGPAGKPAVVSAPAAPVPTPAPVPAAAPAMPVRLHDLVIEGGSVALPIIRSPPISRRGSRPCAAISATSATRPMRLLPSTSTAR
jgi:hypothetical protein